jgi:hypothetical protein
VTPKQQKEAQSAPLDRQEEPLTVVFDKNFHFVSIKIFVFGPKVCRELNFAVRNYGRGL